METKKSDSLRAEFSYVSPEIKEIDIVVSHHILGGSNQNLTPEEGTW